MDKRWLLIIPLGVFWFPKAATIITNNQRTTFGEMFVEQLLKERTELHLISIDMQDETSYAEFDLPTTASEIKSGDNPKDLEVKLYKVYCEQNISQAQKLKITHFNVNIYAEKHELILGRILSPKDCR